MYENGEFVAEFASVVEQAGIRHRRHTPDSLLQVWEKFVDECVASFQGTIEEYYGLLGVRSAIRRVLCSSELSRFTDVVSFAASVSRIDARFLACLDLGQPADIERPDIVDGEAWYWQYFPAYAGDDLVHDLGMHYGYRSSIRGRLSNDREADNDQHGT